MIEQYLHSFACMGTVVSMQTLSSDATPDRIRQRDAALARATSWFQQVEQCCNRFDETSELRQLCRTQDTSVPVSELLFECVQFAVAVAGATHGVFDPTVGARMEARGFDRDYRSGLRTPASVADGAATYRDVELDERTRAITLHKPLLLDLGAVAKGLAIDMAARELRELDDFLIDAGGDVYVGGKNADGAPWRVGIRHPRMPGEHVHTLTVSDVAVCTSGDYERLATDGSGHILHAAHGTPATELASVTVVSPSAMVADALATAAFALGGSEGVRFLEQQGVTGLLITPDLEMRHTADAPVE